MPKNRKQREKKQRTAGPLVITKADGQMEKRPAYSEQQLRRIIARGFARSRDREMSA